MHPTLGAVAKRLIANVEGAMNAVVVQGDAVGTTLYYGKRRRRSEPTASLPLWRTWWTSPACTSADPGHRVPHLAFQPDSLADTPILPIDAGASRLVLPAFDSRRRKAGVLSGITTILAENGISIDAVLQRESAKTVRSQTDLIILTHDTIEGQHAHRAWRSMQALPHRAGPHRQAIRKEELA